MKAPPFRVGMIEKLVIVVILALECLGEQILGCRHGIPSETQKSLRGGTIFLKVLKISMENSSTPETPGKPSPFGLVS